MGKRENLKRNDQRTPEELKAMGAKGGVKSGETRRRRKLERDVIRNLLTMRIKSDREIKKAIRKLGYDIEAEGEPTVEQVMYMSIINQAFNGDLNSARFLHEYAQIPDMRTQLERERIKTMAEGRAKVDVNLTNAEEARAMAEVHERMMAESMEQGSDPHDADAGDGLQVPRGAPG